MESIGPAKKPWERKERNIFSFNLRPTAPLYAHMSVINVQKVKKMAKIDVTKMAHIYSPSLYYIVLQSQAIYYLLSQEF